MKRLSLQALVLSLALLVPVVTAQALPVWLPGDTVVASAGPQGDAMMITAQMLEDETLDIGGTIVSDANSVTFMNGGMHMTELGWEWTWDSITLDQDPIVSFVGGFKNVSASAQDFVFSLATSISPPTPSARCTVGRRS